MTNVSNFVQHIVVKSPLFEFEFEAGISELSSSSSYTVKHVRYFASILSVEDDASLFQTGFYRMCL